MKRRVILAVGIAISVALIVISVWQLTHREFRAAEDDVTASVVVNLVNQDGPMNGLLAIDGDCPDKELGGIDGSFDCDLVASSSIGYLSIKSLVFSDFASGRTFAIPLHKPLPPENIPLTLDPNTSLILNIDLSNFDAPIIKRWNDDAKQLVDFPSSED